MHSGRVKQGRPLFRLNKSAVVPGLLPAEIKEFYAVVNAHREKASGAAVSKAPRRLTRLLAIKVA